MPLNSKQNNVIVKCKSVYTLWQWICEYLVTHLSAENMIWSMCSNCTMFVDVGTQAITASEFHYEKIAKLLKDASFSLPFTGLNIAW